MIINKIKEYKLIDDKLGLNKPKLSSKYVRGINKINFKKTAKSIIEINDFIDGNCILG